MPVIVSASGFPSNELAEFKRMVRDLKGRFTDQPSAKTTVHLCKTAGFPNPTATWQVTEQWLIDSHRRGYFIPSKRKYKLPILRGIKLALMSVPVRYTRFARRHKAVIIPLEQTPELIVTSPEYYELATLIFEGVVVTTEWLDLCKKAWVLPKAFTPTHMPKVSYHLSKYVFFVDVTSAETEAFAKKLIIRGGGTFVNSKGEVVTHVVSDKPQAQGSVVSVEWLKKQCLGL